MPSQKPVIAIRTTQETINKFNKIAKEENRSMSNLAEYLILKHIAAYETEHGLIQIPEEEK